MSLKCYGNYTQEKIGKEKSLKKYLEYSKNTDDLFEKVKEGINNYLEYIKNKFNRKFIY